MRAEIRADELLREMEKKQGHARCRRRQVGRKTSGRKTTPPVDAAPNLADLGITKTQSSRWQKLAGDSADR
jgi:hypothetical protein